MAPAYHTVNAGPCSTDGCTGEKFISWLPQKEAHLIPLAVPEIRHLIERLLLINLPEQRNVLKWSVLRRRHQRSAQLCHYRARGHDPPKEVKYNRSTKAHGSLWRNGTALNLILTTGSYGNPVLSDWLRRNLWTGAVKSHFVVILEIVFPLVLVLPFEGMLIMLIFGVFLHLGVAIVMGLNNFLFALVATYPSIIYCWYRLNRDDGYTDMAGL